MRQSVNELRQLGDLVNLGFGLFIFGSFLIQHHQLEEAESLLKESLALEKQTDFFAIPIQIELARLAFQRQQFEDAEELSHQGFEKASKIGDEFTKINALCMLGKIKLELGQLQEAQQLLILSLQGGWNGKMLLATSRALVYIAELGFALGHTHYSLVLLYFLSEYSAIIKQDKDEVLKLLTTKASSLSTREITRIKNQAKSLSVEEIIRSILSEKTFHFFINE